MTTAHREWFDATYKRLLNDHSHMADLVREACLRGIAAIEASGEARPTPVEPEARDDDDSALHCGYFAPCEQEAHHDGPHMAGMYPEWQVPTIEPISFDHPARRLAVEPDGLPLDVAVAALREITRTVYSDDAPLDSPSYSALHLQAVGIAREALARLTSTPSEAMADRTPTEREPRTRTGRALLAALRNVRISGHNLRSDILAIESEAAGAATETGGLPSVEDLADAFRDVLGPEIAWRPTLVANPWKDYAARVLARLSVHPDREDAPDGGGAT